MSNMFNFKYEIVKDDDGGMYISPDKNQTDHPEHKFMGVELARYLLNELLSDNMKTNDMKQHTLEDTVSASKLLADISLQLCELMTQQNNVMNDAIDDLGLDVQDED